VNDDLTPPLLASTKQHSLSNIHRLANGVTAFPFHDPSPELQSRNPLLGVRIDICDRSGRFDSPYYLFCVRAGEGDGVANQELRIHRHTIPAFVPLEQYESQHLPLLDEGYGTLEDSVLSAGGGARAQDLHGLVQRVRHDLVAWRLRQDALAWLREELRIPEPASPSALPQKPLENNEDRDPDQAEDEDALGSDVDISEPSGRYRVCDVSAVTVDARQARVVWSDGRVGRIKISDQGKIERAVVIGHESRIRGMESILTNGEPTVYNLVARLEKLDKSASKKRFWSRRGS
jgi:central kinetochore subunit Mal2/MCM21